MRILNKEYHEFGPWLLEIKAEEDIPPQYMDKVDQILSAEYAFKVPVLLVRREIRPGALMYNQVVMLRNDEIVALEYKNGTVHETKMAYSDILYVVHGGELLMSYLHFVGAGADLKLKYNSVSTEVTQIVMERVRSTVCSRKTPVQVAPLKLDGELEALKQNQIYKYFCIKEEPKHDHEILGYQPFMHLTEKLPVRLPYFFEKFYMYKLNDTLFMRNASELIVVNRDRTIQKERDVNYAFAHTFVPFSSIEGVDMIEDKSFEAIGRIQLSLQNGCTLTFAVDRNFDWTFLKALSGKSA